MSTSEQDIAPVVCLGYVSDVLTFETRRWLWKPGLLAHRIPGKGWRLLYHRSKGRRYWRIGERWLQFVGGRPYLSEYRVER